MKRTRIGKFQKEANKANKLIHNSMVVTRGEGGCGVRVKRVKRAKYSGGKTLDFRWRAHNAKYRLYVNRIIHLKLI